MLDIKEFYKAKKRIFKNQNSLHTLSDFEKYFIDLELVCANEKSSKLADLLENVISKAIKVDNSLLLFKLYWIYFLQIYQYIKRIEQAEDLVKKMKKIAIKDEIVELEAVVYLAESLIAQMKGNKTESNKYATTAMGMIVPYQRTRPDSYYQILYTFTLFITDKEKKYSEGIQRIEECLYYYYESYNTLGMIKTIFLLLRLYLLSGNEEKIDELHHWILVKNQIQKKLIDEHYALLYGILGSISTIRNKINLAKEFLFSAYSRIKTNNLQFQQMYLFAEFLRLLSRCYAYQGKFEQSYNLLVELIDFIETDYIKSNYLKKRIKRLYFSSYYTLLFIFVQLDVDITKLQDDKLRRVYEYTKSLLTESQTSKEFLLSTSLDEKSTQNILENETEKSSDEIYLALHQITMTQKPYFVSDETVNVIHKLKEASHDPFYAEVLLGKIHLSIGNYPEFKKSVKNIMELAREVDVPIFKVWKDFFTLLLRFIEEPENKEIIKEFEELERFCEENNFRKIAEEVKLYRKLLSSTKMIESVKDRFKHTAFIDVFNDQSKQIVMDYFES